MEPSSSGPDRVDLLWLPLGAGGHVVRLNGRVYEAIVAARERRPRCDLYHAALEIWLGGERYAVEMGPVWGNPAADRGVVVEGPVGARLLGRSRAFRYEVRRWRDGVIPDAGEAVDSPRTVTHDPGRVRRVLGLLAQLPPLVWGRDEIRAGECGTRTRWWPGCWPAAASTPTTRSSRCRRAVVPPAGGPAWSSPPGTPPGIGRRRHTAAIDRL